MRVRLKGINPVPKRLADGTWKTYWYAWKGGPPLRGEPGTPEFVHSYNEAIARKVATPQGTLQAPLRAFEASAEFSGLAERTRGIFMAWRDRLAARSRRQADYAWQVLARVLSWALDRGLVLANPCARGGRL